MSAINYKLIKDNNSLIKELTAKDTSGEDFDFATSKIKIDRTGSDFYQLGDVELAIRKDTQANWLKFNTKDDQELASSPVKVDRVWNSDGDTVTFDVTLKNNTTDRYEIGGLGFAMIFNQIFTENTLDESHNNSSFIDPYIGQDAGYLQVARLNGASPALLVFNGGDTPFEAYRPLDDDKTKKDVHFEGFYEWSVYSRAYFENEWNYKKQWNTATSAFLDGGAEKTYQLKFVSVDNVRQIPSELTAQDIPTVDSLPGYTIHGKETVTLEIAEKFEVSQLTAEPANAIKISNTSQNNVFTLSRIADFFGQVKLTIKYTNGMIQTVNYFVTESAYDLVDKLAKFHESQQWIDVPDKYGRQHSFMSYDREANRQAIDEYRSYISGDSDEAGAGPNLLMAIKNLYMPNKKQVSMLEQYVDDVLWGNLQSFDYSIKASLYYENNDFVYSWHKDRSSETWRAYNYPHQATIYWVMYRLARNYDGLVNNHSWEWYLEHAYNTVMAMNKFCGKDAFLYLEQYGLMVGSVHKWILEDLYAEDWSDKASEYAEYMKYRYNIWASLQYPYGSEMPWDSTGQEEVYTWCDYFDDQELASKTVGAILAYTPSIPHWGYNGAARRYFDSYVYGKRVKITREFGHYGSSLNAIPIINDYKYHNSDDFYNLKVGYAASTSILNSIDQEGFGSMAFLTDPEYMEFEPYTSDFGQAFYGYAHDAGEYVFENKGKWTAFGGTVEQDADKVNLQPNDAFRHRLFIHTGNGDYEVNSEVMPIKDAILDLTANTITVKFDHPEVKPNHIRIKTSANLVPEESTSVVRTAFEFSLNQANITFKIKK